MRVILLDGYENKYLTIIHQSGPYKSYQTSYSITRIYLQSRQEYKYYQFRRLDILCDSMDNINLKYDLSIIESACYCCSQNLFPVCYDSANVTFDEWQNKLKYAGALIIPYLPHDFE